MKPVSLCLFILLCTTAINGQTADYVVRPDVTPCLNVREAHNSIADVLICIPPGTQLTSNETIPYWRKVSLPDGRTGWAAKKFLIEPTAPADNTDSIPANAWLEVHFVDVGQGDGIWIHTFDDGLANGRFEGRNIVIDGGLSMGSDH